MPEVERLESNHSTIRAAGRCKDQPNLKSNNADSVFWRPERGNSKSLFPYLGISSQPFENYYEIAKSNNDAIIATRLFMDDDFVRAARAKKGSPFLNTEQSAFYLGLSPRKLQDMRRAEIGPRYRRHGRFVRYHIDDLDHWSDLVAAGEGAT